MRAQPRRVRRSSVVFTQNQSYDGHDGDEGPLPAHSLRQAPGHHAQGQEQSDARQIVAVLEIKFQGNDRRLEQMRGEKEDRSERDGGPGAGAQTPGQN